MLLLTPLAWGFVLIYGKKRVVFRARQPNPTSLFTRFVPVLRALAPTLYICILVIIVRSFLHLRALVFAFSLRTTSLAMASIQLYTTHTFLESMMASLHTNNTCHTGVIPVALSSVNPSDLGFLW